MAFGGKFRRWKINDMKRLWAGVLVVFGLGSILTGCQTSDVKDVATKKVSVIEKLRGPGPSGRWKPFDKDLIHDPTAGALHLLQRPWEAFANFPVAKDGNQIDWVRALRDGHIEPRETLYPETPVLKLDLDVYFTPFGHFPIVKFPHDIHTEWLGCNSCHDKIFKRKIGGSTVRMLSILRREQCGICHSKVAFPLTQCAKCHAIPHKRLRGIVERHEERTGEGMRVGSGTQPILRVNTKGPIK